MPLPGNYSTRTVAGTILDLNSGNPAAGSIAFTPELTNQFIIDAGADTVIAPRKTSVQLDANGTFSVTLGTTDDPDISPNGWTYEVEIVTAGASGEESLRTVYSVQIPAGGGTLNLADISPSVASGGQVILVKSVNGVTPDASGNITLIGLLAVLNTNTGFETNTTGWEGSGGTIARVTSQFFAGAASLELTPDGVTATVEARFTTAASPSVVVGESYYAAGWVMSPTGYSAVSIVIDWLDSLDAVISTTASSTVDLDNSKWTYLSIRGVAPATTYKARVKFRETGTPAASQKLYVDEAILTVTAIGNLGSLGDVDTSTQTNKDVLQYDSGTGKWKDVALPLDDLGNVSVPTPASGNVLSYNSGTSQWEATAQLPLASDTVNVFTSSGTWTKPTGIKGVWVRVVGGGGSGGGVPATAAGQEAEGGGGSGGEYAEKIIPAASLGATETVTVGAGGAAAAAGVGGNNGGTSSFGSHVSAGAGQAGAVGVASAGASLATGGNGGTGGTGGDIQVLGGAAGNGRTIAATASKSNHGGGTVLAPLVISRAHPSNGTTGALYGGGSSGASNTASQSSRAGAAAQSGLVIVQNIF